MFGHGGAIGSEVFADQETGYAERGILSFNGHEVSLEDGRIFGDAV